ncbi:META domain-containing protein [Phyllobacterium sp. OV277]|uniref:META domain-containing protein n=1 Tax=Phyllobacterium sp. OV277 TaxID=1882772 RepID=UPI00088CF109|nr:META domain-containing protein [Phyllobacterium sp. OV277]SDO96431.1 Heat shock protein HslJ [Phyllobacterium sp. OV277]
MRRLAILSLIIGFIGVIALFGLSFKARSEQRVPVITDVSWLAEDLDGGGVIDFAQTTLMIDHDNNVSGSGGCNRFMSKATFRGLKLTFTPAAATRKLCPPALMNQENKFFAVLEQTRSFLVVDGKLTLRGTAGKTIARLARQN